MHEPTEHSHMESPPDRKEGFHQFLREGTAEPFGSFEVFFSEETEDTFEGWFWWSCFPGCLPDGDPVGPFPNSYEAWKNALWA